MQLFTSINEFLKKHVWAGLSGAFGAGVLTTITIFADVEQDRVARFEASMIAEYQAVAESKRELYTSLDVFSALLAGGKKPEVSLVSEMNARLLDLHQRVDMFNIGLSEYDRQKIADVKRALENMKLEIARAKTKDDLQYVAGRQAQFEVAYKAALPIVERKMGVPSGMLSG